MFQSIYWISVGAHTRRGARHVCSLPPTLITSLLFAMWNKSDEWLHKHIRLLWRNLGLYRRLYDDSTDQIKIWLLRSPKWAQLCVERKYTIVVFGKPKSFRVKSQSLKNQLQTLKNIKYYLQIFIKHELNSSPLRGSWLWFQLIGALLTPADWDCAFLKQTWIIHIYPPSLILPLLLVMQQECRSNNYASHGKTLISSAPPCI